MKNGTKFFIIKGIKLSFYLLLSVLLLLSSSCKKNEYTGYSVMKGPFRQSVIETGELQPVNASNVNMPAINYIYGYEFKIIGLAEHGKSVKKGDQVIIVDPSSVQKYIIERSELLENEKALVTKLKAQQTNNLQDLKSRLRNELASYDIKKLRVEKAGFESVGIRKIMELEFRQAQIKLDKLKRTLDLRPKLDSLDFCIQQIKVSQKENELKTAKDVLNQFVVLSPLDGIFVVKESWRTGQTFKIGDAVQIGQPVAMIPDIRYMRVKGVVQENDISKIKSGLPVIIRLDALPNVAFHGKISRIGKICILQEEKKIFPTEVLIDESDLRLKPGMTVSCEYITYEGRDDLYVPNNCIVTENKHYYIYLKKRGKIRKTEITTGPSNNMFTIVSGDIKPGQALELPENILNK